MSVIEAKPISSFAQKLGETLETKRKFRVAIVAPVHIQPSKKWVDMLEAQRLASGASVIIVDDSNGKVELPDTWDIYDYDRQREEMGDELYEKFEQFHHSAACKNFGTWLAYQRGFDPIIVIDSDCIVPPDFVAKHIGALFYTTGEGWSNPLEGSGWYSRGYPYHLRGLQKWAHMGLWENELDLYGSDRMLASTTPPSEPPSFFTHPENAQFFPLSGMNVAFRKDAIPFMMFLPNFEHEGMHFTRHDDIWGGYIFQKFCQRHLKGLSYGDPVVYHDTVVVAHEDAKQEEAMIKHEIDFYEAIDYLLQDPQRATMYGDLLSLPPPEVIKPLISAITFWCDAFKNYDAN